MPKLLQINSVVNKGSTGRIVEQIGQYAFRKGWESYIAYGRKSNESASKLIKIGNEFDITFHGFQSRLFDQHGLGSVKATKDLLTKIKLINPDIIHLHNIHGYYINYKILFNFLANENIPVVWTLHDCWAMTGHCSYFSDISCEKWKIECHHCPKRKNYPSSILIDCSRYNYKLKKQTFTTLNNLIIVPVSKWLGGIVQNSYLADFPMNIIYNGVDTNAFRPVSNNLEIKKKYGLTEKFVLIGVATSWGTNKGLDDYKKLSRLLSNEYIIVLVGVSKNIKQKLPSNIIGVERTENIKELAELYSAADIVLNLSYQETFGMTTVEGFSCGTPGIVYNTTASPELMTKQTGIIVDPGNIKMLINAINRIKSKGKEFYSANCRKHAVLNYNKEKRFNEYIQLYEKLIK